jgi:branched-subunit amino acid ABC-type transport system permease component
VPFIGDLVGVLLSSYILREAARLGAGRSVLARMAFNIALEGLVGLIPFAGDVFDAAWKANQRNVRLLGDWLDRPARTARASRLFVCALIAALIALVALILVLTYLLLRWLVA